MGLPPFLLPEEMLAGLWGLSHSDSGYEGRRNGGTISATWGSLPWTDIARYMGISPPLKCYRANPHLSGQQPCTLTTGPPRLGEAMRVTSQILPHAQMLNLQGLAWFTC